MEKVSLFLIINTKILTKIFFSEKKIVTKNSDNLFLKRFMLKINLNFLVKSSLLN